MSLTDRLRHLVAALPAGGSVTLTGDALRQLLAEADDEPLVDFTVRQVARLLGLSESVVRRQLETEALRGYKAGATWYVPSSSVQEYQAKQRQDRPLLRAVPVRRRGLG